MQGNTASEMVIVRRIEQVIETAHKEVTDLQGDLVDINTKLLPAQPIAKEAQGEVKSSPTGWFEEILQRLTSLRGKIQVARLDEAQRLKTAVAAGEVKRAE